LSEQQDRKRIMAFLFIGVGFIALVGLSPFLVERFAKEPMEVSLSIFPDKGPAPLAVNAQALILNSGADTPEVIWFLNGEEKKKGIETTLDLSLPEGEHQVKVVVSVGSELVSVMQTLSVGPAEELAESQSESK